MLCLSFLLGVLNVNTYMCCLQSHKQANKKQVDLQTSTAMKANTRNS